MKRLFFTTVMLDFCFHNICFADSVVHSSDLVLIFHLLINFITFYTDADILFA